MIEKKILIQAKKDDEEAIEEVIKTYKGVIYKYSKKFFLNGGDFNDLVQEGYIGLIKALVNYDEKKDASFNTFAILCIKRQMITAVKKANIEKYKSLNEAIQDGSYLKKQEKISYSISSNDYYSPESIILGKELISLLEIYLKKNLSKFEKDVFYYLSKQLTYTEIAKILNNDPKCIDNAIQRIKKKTYEYLNSYVK